MNDVALKAGLKFLDSWLGYRARQLDLPGFCVTVFYKDRAVFSQAYGFADIERKEPLTTQHVFGIASQSKMFTATAILQLVEKGKLRLDDYATTYLPWLNEHRDKRLQKITVRQLISHSAGLIRDGIEADFWQLARPFPDAAELRDMVLAADLAIEPNTELKYSNLGIGLLGQIVEATSGQTHTEYVTEHIIKPLQLKHTFADYSAKLDNQLATPYGEPFEHYRSPLWPRQSTNALAPAAGIHITPEDMCQFISAHFIGDKRLLTDESKREAQRTHWSATRYDQGIEFGLGFEVQRIGERRVVGHSGHMAGYVTATFFDAEQQLAVNVMGNGREVPSVQIVRGVFEALDYFAEHRNASTSKELERFNVRLHNATSSVEIVATNKGIVAIDPDDWEPFTWAEELKQVDANTLRIITPGSVFNMGEVVRYSFDANAVGSVNYAGAPLLPEPAYRRLIRKRLPNKNGRP